MYWWFFVVAIGWIGLCLLPFVGELAIGFLWLIGVIIGEVLDCAGEAFFFIRGRFMRLFNSFQLCCMFAGFPFLIGWLQDASFKNSDKAFWAAVVAYVVAFGFQWVATYDAMRDNGPFGRN